MSQTDLYSVICQWSDEDEGYIAFVPELRGLSAFGETRAEALEELELAKEAYLKVFEEDGCQLPDPKRMQEFSGQLRVRLPKWLHAELSREAEREGVSLNMFIVSLLSDRNRVAKVEKDINVLKHCYFKTILSGEMSNNIIHAGTSTVSSETQQIQEYMT
jgi:predicted RNase H-like HicB family nuclease